MRRAGRPARTSTTPLGNLPELFIEPRYRELTLRLWRDLATRYRDETVVLGYDLLNEPLPNEWQYSLRR